MGRGPWLLCNGTSDLSERDRIYEVHAYSVAVDSRQEVTLSDEHCEARWVTPAEGRALDLAGPFTARVLSKLEEVP